MVASNIANKAGPRILRWQACLVVLLLLATSLARAGELYSFSDAVLKKRADAMLALLSYSTILDLAASSLSIQSANSGRSDLWMTQLGGGATVSDSVPLYLEGSVAASRYDPTFVTSNGQDTSLLPVKWNAVAASGGIGWDFAVSENLVFRPIFTFSLGYLASDIKLADWYLQYKTGYQMNFLNGGSMQAGGLGGAAMLVYHRQFEQGEAEVELRYSMIRLESLHADDAVSGAANSQTANIYARWRTPVDVIVLGKPMRIVYEASHSQYFGDQAGMLGFNALSTLGAGVEFNTVDYPWMVVSKVRLVGRYMFGHNVTGFSVGLAASF